MADRIAQDALFDAMASASLVVTRRDGTRIFYRLASDRVASCRGPTAGTPMRRWVN